jgi:hypothetical protein
VIRSFRTQWLLFSAAVLLAIMVVAAYGPVVEAQSGTRIGGATQAIPQPTFEQKLWDYLKGARYENWAPIPGKSDDFYAGQSPHGDFLKLYVNRVAAGHPKELPHGSVLVKENYGRDKRTLMAITVMYRSKDFDPTSQDWYYVKYEPNGKASEMLGVRVAGKVKMCIDCHSTANGGDFVFAND